MTDLPPIWKFVTGAGPNKSSSCELYHYYNAKIVHKRSITCQGIETIWRHFLKWDCDTKELIYYDGRGQHQGEKKESFKEVISFDKCILDNNKLYINIQPRDMLIWTWCLNLENDNIELRQWERKLCKFCDPKVRIQRNGCYDFKLVEEEHKEECPYRHNIPKMGLQDKYYYVMRTPEEASMSPPQDLRTQKKNPFEWTDPWGLILSGKRELTDARKYFQKKNTEDAYSRFTEKSDEDKVKQGIREVINKGSIDNITEIINYIKEQQNPWVQSFVCSYLYSTYKTVKEYPHIEIIKRLNLSIKIWKLFKEELFQSTLDDTSLKFKCCLIAILYKEGVLNNLEVQHTLSAINSYQQAVNIIYFFSWDSKYGLFVGLVHNNLKDFSIVINKLQDMYDSLPAKVQFTIDDLLEEL